MCATFEKYGQGIFGGILLFTGVLYCIRHPPPVVEEIPCNILKSDSINKRVYELKTGESFPHTKACHLGGCPGNRSTCGEHMMEGIVGPCYCYPGCEKDTVGPQNCNIPSKPSVTFGRIQCDLERICLGTPYVKCRVVLRFIRIIVHQVQIIDFRSKNPQGDPLSITTTLDHLRLEPSVISPGPHTCYLPWKGDIRHELSVYSIEDYQTWFRYHMESTGGVLVLGCMLFGLLLKVILQALLGGIALRCMGEDTRLDR